MKITKEKLYFWISGALTLLFVVFTLLVKFVDVQSVGPLGSEIGFAGVNSTVHNAIGVNDFWNTLSEILGLIPLAVAVIFAIIGLVDAIRGKSIKAVQANTMFLGSIYCLALGLYMFFEFVIINFRPVLESGELAASYPSSHTLLTCVVMGCAIVWLMKSNLKSTMKLTFSAAALVVGICGIIARLLSGQHWLTDILGGLIIGVALVFFYMGLVEKKQKIDEKRSDETNGIQSDCAEKTTSDIV